MPPVIENVITIERHAIHPDFKMTMLRRSPTGAPHGGYHVTGFHPITYTNQIPGIMTVTSLQTVGMAHYHHIPVCRVLSGEADYPVEHRPYLVVRFRLQIRSCMVLTCPTVGTDHLGTKQQIGRASCRERV